MSLHSTDHYFGIYATEDISEINQYSSTLAQNFRNRRKQFLDMISEVKLENRIKLIELEFEDVKNQLEKSSPETLKQLFNDELFNDNTTLIRIDIDINLLNASYIKFLSILQKRYHRIEELNFSDVKWLKDYSSFQRFYEILNKYNIINSDYYRFQNFFLIDRKSVV